jgi:prepilin-type N-terminal cleavage/methylation domain-containing protein
MDHRRGVSMIETLVVSAIIGVLVGLLLPAVLAARMRALETQCKNSLRQMNVAVADFAEAHKRLPGPGSWGLVGGWSIDVLPFLEQNNLRDRVAPGAPIASAPDYLLRQPRILCCPVRSGRTEPVDGLMEEANYVFVPKDGRKTFHIFDAPLGVSVPWASGPEMSYDEVVRQTGPHRRGFFFASGFQEGVGFISDGQRTR